MQGVCALGGRRWQGTEAGYSGAMSSSAHGRVLEAVEGTCVLEGPLWGWNGTDHCGKLLSNREPFSATCHPQAFGRLCPLPGNLFIPCSLNGCASPVFLASASLAPLTPGRLATSPGFPPTPEPPPSFDPSVACASLPRY